MHKAFAVCPNVDGDSGHEGQQGTPDLRTGGRVRRTADPSRTSQAKPVLGRTAVRKIMFMSGDVVISVPPDRGTAGISPITAVGEGQAAISEHVRFDWGRPVHLGDGRESQFRKLTDGTSHQLTQGASHRKALHVSIQDTAFIMG